MCSDKILAKINIKMHFYITSAIFVMQKTTSFWRWDKVPRPSTEISLLDLTEGLLSPMH